MRIAERDLAKGVRIAAVADASPAIALAEIALDRPGVLRLDPATPWRASGQFYRQLSAAETTAAAGTSLWVAADLAPGAREATIRGERVVVTVDAPVSIDLPADGTAVACDLGPRSPGPVLVSASAISGRPAVSIVARDQAGRAGAAAIATAPVGERAATALVDTTDAPAALFWRADPAAPAARATLRLFTFAEPVEEKLRPGQTRGSLVPAGARRFTLPRGDKRLRLSLGQGLAAALVRGGRTESARDAGGGTLEETAETDAEILLLVNAGIAPSPWAVEILQLEDHERAAAVTPAAPRIERFSAAGTERIAIAPEEGRGSALRLRTTGTAGAATYLAADGRILAGSSFPVGTGGDLLLPHGQSIAAAWIERPGDKASGLWGDAPAPRDLAIGAAGVQRLLGKTAGLTVKVSAPSILRLGADDALVVVIRRPAGPAEEFVQLQAAPLDLLLAPGTTSLWLRTAAGSELHGSAEILSAAVTPIGEGLGPELLLAPGTAHYFSFTIERQGTLGIGVRAVPDSATCHLLDAAGKAIGDGIVQMPNLAPGAYLLAVRAPADGGPVTVRPALAGITPPGSGPPEDVVRRYLRLGAGEPENEGSIAPAPEPQSPGAVEGD